MDEGQAVEYDRCHGICCKGLENENELRSSKEKTDLANEIWVGVVKIIPSNSDIKKKDYGKVKKHQGWKRHDTMSHDSCPCPTQETRTRQQEVAVAWKHFTQFKRSNSVTRTQNTWLFAHFACRHFIQRWMQIYVMKQVGVKHLAQVCLQVRLRSLGIKHPLHLSWPPLSRISRKESIHWCDRSLDNWNHLPTISRLAVEVWRKVAVDISSNQTRGCAHHSRKQALTGVWEIERSGQIPDNWIN